MPNFASIWEGIAEAIPEEPAQVHHDLTVSWAEFENRAARLAEGLQERGIGRDDKVALYLYNGPEYLQTEFAAFKLGAIPCNVNYRYLVDELEYLLRNSDAKAIVFDESLRGHVLAASGRCPDLEVLVQVGDGAGTDGVVSLDEMMSHEPAVAIHRTGDEMWFLYTGGTTGHPKAVMWRHKDLLGTMVNPYRVIDRAVPTTVDEAVDAALEVHQRDRVTRVLAAAPLMHGTSRIPSIQFLTQGGMVATLQSRTLDADELWTQVARHRLTMLTIVGDAFAKPMLAALDEAEASGNPYDLSSVYQILSSGTMWSAESKEAFLRHKDMTLLDTLGSSEGLGFGNKIARRDEPPTTAKFRLGETACVLTDDGREVMPGSGEQGRLAVGGVLPVGYYKDSEKSAATWPTINGRRWSIPGDYATVESDGSITLLGRGFDQHQLRGREDLPRRGGGSAQITPGRSRQHRCRTA